MRNLKPDSFIPNGVELLKLRRDENKLADLFEEVDIEQDEENDSDYSIEDLLT